MDANTIIDRLGGTSKVSELCEVTTGAVSQWRTEGIPHARLMFLKAIRPDVFLPEEPGKAEKVRGTFIGKQPAGKDA